MCEFPCRFFYELKNEVIAELRAEKEAQVKTRIKSILQGIIAQQTYIATAQKSILEYQRQLALVEIEEIDEKSLI